MKKIKDADLRIIGEKLDELIALQGRQVAALEALTKKPESKPSEPTPGRAPVRDWTFAGVGSVPRGEVPPP